MKKIKLFSLALMALFSSSLWSANETVTIGSKSSGAFTIDGTTHSVAGYSGGTSSQTLTDADDGFSASAGSKMGSTSNKGSALSSKNHIRFTVAANETVRFYYFQTGGTDKSTTFATSDYSQSAAYYHAGTEKVAAAKNALYYIDFLFEDAGTYAISVTTGQSVYMAGLKFTAAAATYTVTFDANGHGVAPAAQDNLESGAKVTKPSDPSELGWIFRGWYNKTDSAAVGAEKWDFANSTVTQDTTLYAIWKEDTNVTKYHVTYDLNGPTGETPTHADVAEGAEITLADEPTWDGHGFLGWYDGTKTYNAGDTYEMPAADVEFEAQWCTSITPALSYNYTIVYPTFGIDILPTITGNTGAGSVTYEGNNDAVATVNTTTGEITPVAAGTVTITATIAANGDYCENTATATIKVVAAPEKLIEQRLATGGSATWDASELVTKDYTNISGLNALSQHGAATASGSGKSGMTSKIATVAAESNDNYLEFSFTIAEDKRLDISAVGIKVQSVSSDVNNFKVVLSDNKGSDEIIGTKTNATNGNLVDVDFSSYGILKGTVTVRVYAWGWTDGYRLGTGITIDGTIKDIATALDNTADEAKVVKFIENGQVVIFKDGKYYNVLGMQIR